MSFWSQVESCPNGNYTNLLIFKTNIRILVTSWKLLNSYCYLSFKAYSLLVISRPRIMLNTLARYDSFINKYSKLCLDQNIYRHIEPAKIDTYKAKYFIQSYNRTAQGFLICIKIKRVSVGLEFLWSYLYKCYDLWSVKYFTIQTDW